jgi:hypothetical protein
MPDPGVEVMMRSLGANGSQPDRWADSVSSSSSVIGNRINPAGAGKVAAKPAAATAAAMATAAKGGGRGTSGPGANTFFGSSANYK